jgi:hypothetical protein
LKRGEPLDRIVEERGTGKSLCPGGKQGGQLGSRGKRAWRDGATKVSFSWDSALRGNFHFLRVTQPICPIWKGCRQERGGGRGRGRLSLGLLLLMFVLDAFGTKVNNNTPNRRDRSLPCNTATGCLCLGGLWWRPKQRPLALTMMTVSTLGEGGGGDIHRSWPSDVARLGHLWGSGRGHNTSATQQPPFLRRHVTAQGHVSSVKLHSCTVHSPQPTGMLSSDAGQAQCE